jgi:hypothetical protein
MNNSNPDTRSRNIGIVDNLIDGACHRGDLPFGSPTFAPEPMPIGKI